MSNKSYSLNQLKDLLDSSSHCAFVVGNPIEHSLSPVMHNFSAQYHGLDLKYVKLHLLEKDLTSFQSILNHDAFVGCNITIPYKETFIEFIDQIDPLADKIGAVNTICRKNWQLKGFNTDVYGFLKPLEEYEYEFEATNAVIFGTGGAAKAVTFALQTIGVTEVTIVSRNPSGNKFEIEDSEIRMATYDNWTAFVDSETSMVINTTPFGQGKLQNESPIREDQAFYLRDKVCYDLVYGRSFSPFLNMALKYQGFPIDGLEMLIHQADAAFEIWTGHHFPIHDVRSKIKEFLIS